MPPLHMRCHFHFDVIDYAVTRGAILMADATAAAVVSPLFMIFMAEQNIVDSDFLLSIIAIDAFFRCFR